MAIVYDIHQAAPPATTETDIYTVPTGKSFVESTGVVCNRGNTATTFRWSCARTGAATQAKDYLYYDVPIAGNDTFGFTFGLTLPAGAVVRVYAGNANLSFSLNGGEKS